MNSNIYILGCCWGDNFHEWCDEKNFNDCQLFNFYYDLCFLALL